MAQKRIPTGLTYRSLVERRLVLKNEGNHHDVICIVCGEQVDPSSTSSTQSSEFGGMPAGYAPIQVCHSCKFANPEIRQGRGHFYFSDIGQYTPECWWKTDD